MATLLSSSSSSLLFTNLSPPSLSPVCFSLSSLSFSSSASLSSSISLFPRSVSSYSRKLSLSSFTVKAIASEKKKVLIVNTNSGGHAVIGFYFAKELLGSGHDVTILTVGDESSDKMKKPPFSRFSVNTNPIVFIFLFAVLIDIFMFWFLGAVDFIQFWHKNVIFFMGIFKKSWVL